MDRGAWWATVHGAAEDIGMTQQLNNNNKLCREHLISSTQLHPPCHIVSFYHQSLFHPRCEWQPSCLKSRRSFKFFPITPSTHIRTSFPGSSVGKESACSSGDPGSIPGSGRSPGEGDGNPFQYSCLENPMDRGACWTMLHKFAKSQTGLK